MNRKFDSMTDVSVMWPKAAAPVFGTAELDLEDGMSDGMHRAFVEIYKVLPPEGGTDGTESYSGRITGTRSAASIFLLVSQKRIQYQETELTVSYREEDALRCFTSTFGD